MQGLSPPRRVAAHSASADVSQQGPFPGDKACSALIISGHTTCTAATGQDPIGLAANAGLWQPSDGCFSSCHCYTFQVLLLTKYPSEHVIADVEAA